jgi:hypothetical protein
MATFHYYVALVWPYASIMLLAFFQNVSFSIVSRSRNRSSIRYHIVAAVASNGVWFLTFRQLVLSQMSVALFPFYTVGTVAGSVVGVRISMWIESKLGATSDGHILSK